MPSKMTGKELGFTHSFWILGLTDTTGVVADTGVVAGWQRHGKKIAGSGELKVSFCFAMCPCFWPM
jgi:hypothetical protein